MAEKVKVYVLLTDQHKAELGYSTSFSINISISEWNKPGGLFGAVEREMPWEGYLNDQDYTIYEKKPHKGQRTVYISPIKKGRR